MLVSTLVEEGFAALEGGVNALDGGADALAGNAEQAIGSLDVTGGSENPNPTTTAGGSAGTVTSGEETGSSGSQDSGGGGGGGDEQDWPDDPDFEKDAQELNIWWRVLDAAGTFFGGPIVTAADWTLNAGEAFYRGAKTITTINESEVGTVGSEHIENTKDGNPGTDLGAALEQERRIGPPDRGDK